MSVSHVRPKVTRDVLRAADAREVKGQMKKTVKEPKWADECDQKMKAIIKAKADQVPEVKEKLMNTGDKIIAEAVVSDTYWSCGLSKEAAANTEPAHWPGQNRLGRLWMELRREYRDEENAKKDFQTVGKNGKPITETPMKRKLSDGESGNVTSRNRKNGTTRHGW